MTLPAGGGGKGNKGTKSIMGIMGKMLLTDPEQIDEGVIIDILDDYYTALDRQLELICNGEFPVVFGLEISQLIAIKQKVIFRAKEWMKEYEWSE